MYASSGQSTEPLWMEVSGHTVMEATEWTLDDPARTPVAEDEWASLTLLMHFN